MGAAKPQSARNCNRHARCADTCNASQALRHCTFCRCQLCAFCSPRSPNTPWDQRASKAVFRGSLLRLNSYTWRWRQEGARRTPVSATNWRDTSRTALVRLKSEQPHLMNVHMTGNGLEGHSDDLPRRLGIPSDVWEAQDTPLQMPFEEQLNFKYAINAEGHGGWADRLYKMMLHDQLVLMQDLPARLWYEAPLRPWEEYIPVDAAWSNLSMAIIWARQNDEKARHMAASAKSRMQEWTAPGAMFLYTEELLLGYAGLQKSAPERPDRSVRFECDEAPADERATAAPQVCWAPGRGKVNRGEARCYFEAGGQRHNSVYLASRSLRRESGWHAARNRLREVLSGRLADPVSPWGLAHADGTLQSSAPHQDSPHHIRILRTTRVKNQTDRRKHGHGLRHTSFKNG